MFSHYGGNYVKGHLRANLIDSAGNRLDNVPVPRLFALDAFQAITGMQRAMARGTMQEKHQLLSFILRELNSRPWRARGERWCSARPTPGQRFTAIEIVQVMIHFDRYDPVTEKPMEKPRLLIRHEEPGDGYIG
jgi:hypothetical protein